MAGAKATRSYQRWSIKGHQIQLADGHECVDVDHESKNVQLWTCDEHNENQGMSCISMTTGQQRRLTGRIPVR